MHPDNPPARGAAPAAMVAGMWYYLAPIGLLLLIVVFVVWFTAGGDPLTTHDEVDGPGPAPTTGQETPGVFGPGRPSDAQDEIEFRGMEPDEPDRQER